MRFSMSRRTGTWHWLLALSALAFSRPNAGRPAWLPNACTLACAARRSPEVHVQPDSSSSAMASFAEM